MRNQKARGKERGNPSVHRRTKGFPALSDAAVRSCSMFYEVPLKTGDAIMNRSYIVLRNIAPAPSKTRGGVRASMTRVAAAPEVEIAELSGKSVKKAMQEKSTMAMAPVVPM
ncbi:MAG: peptidase S8, partial [Chlorobium limicola]|nr:peptidase S8 [Chlorobium limicola]